MNNRLLPLLALAIAALVASTSGCATKRFVRNQTEPIDARVGELDKRSAENAQKIGSLDEKSSRDISRVEEKAVAADARGQEAGQKAGEALTKTGQAMERADGARSLAQNSLARTDQLQRYVDGLDNFQTSASKTVYFGFNKSVLTEEGKQELDVLAQSLPNLKRYVIEVQGFTDVTGDPDYNYELSEKRAAAVVRYLTEKHNVPVYRVHTIGLGKDMPAQAENKREARKLSRRVEAKVYTLKEMLQSAQQTAPSSPATQPAPAEPPKPPEER